MKTKTILWLAGGALAAYVAWRWWKGRGASSGPRTVSFSTPPTRTTSTGFTPTNTTGGYVPGRSAAERAAIAARNAAIRDDPRYSSNRQTPEMPDAGDSMNGVTFRDGDGGGL